MKRVIELSRLIGFIITV